MWLQSTRLRLLRPTDRVCDTALATARRQINEWTVRQFITHYDNVVPLFCAETSVQFDKLYMSIDESLQKLSELLYYQLVRTTAVKNFLRQCYKVVNKDSGKLNAIFIVGDSNAGKTIFADAITSFFLNRGCMRNPSRQERFSFQECADRRIILWDEARLDPGNYDNIKRLLAGDECKVAVKFKEDQLVKRTPMIVCSNNCIFPANDEFYNRIVSYRWRAYNRWHAHDYNRKISPLAVAIMLAWASGEFSDTMDFTTVRLTLSRAKQAIRDYTHCIERLYNAEQIDDDDNNDNDPVVVAV